MQGNRRAREAALLVPLLGVFLILPPILGLFDGPHSIGGVPILHVYVFLVWLGLVIAGFWLSRRLVREAADAEPDREAAPPTAVDGNDGGA